MRNTGGRNAGTINGGIFLKQDSAPKGVPWAHVDFAAVAHMEKEQAGWPSGATGFGVALGRVEFLETPFRSRGELSDRPPGESGVVEPALWSSGAAA